MWLSAAFSGDWRCRSSRYLPRTNGLIGKRPLSASSRDARDSSPSLIRLNARTIRAIDLENANRFRRVGASIANGYLRGFQKILSSGWHIVHLEIAATHV